MRPLHNILVPIDLTRSAAPVLDYAAALAPTLDAELHVLHVVPWPLLGDVVPIAVTGIELEESMARTRKAFDKLVAAHVATPPLGSAVVEKGDPLTVILAAARRLSAALTVMGTQGRRGVSRFLLGSIAESVARAAICPVLIVRSGLVTSDDRVPAANEVIPAAYHM